MLEGPNYIGRSPAQIISDDIYFDSVGFIYRALSWLDIAKTDNNVCALQYSAHDTRQAIEQLFFEEVILSVGTKLDRHEYQKCKGNSTKLHKIIKRLNPDYEKLAEFTQAVASVLGPEPTRLVTWDHRKLMRDWGKVSHYLHWAGEPAETYESHNWFTDGITVVEAAASFIWDNKKSGYTCIMMPEDMQPELLECWARFRAGELGIDGVKRTAHIALPVLTKRLNP